MKVIKNLIITIMLFSTVVSASGCSVVMAAKQADKKDVNLLNVGTPRYLTIAEFGLPRKTEEIDGKKTDIFMFTQGYSKGNKMGRAFFHIMADSFTLGAWEVIGTPTEMIADGKEMKIRVIYNLEDKIEKVEYVNTKKLGDKKSDSDKSK